MPETKLRHHIARKQQRCEHDHAIRPGDLYWVEVHLPQTIRYYINADEGWESEDLPFMIRKVCHTHHLMERS